MRHACRVKIKRVLASTVTVASLAFVAACGESEQPNTDFLDDVKTTQVSGRLLIVDADGANAKPSAGAVTLTGENGATVSTNVTRSGIFELEVNPGTYQVAGTSPQPDGGTAACAPKERTLVVSETSPAPVDVLCFVQVVPG